MLKGKSVILVTHHLNFAKEADHIVVLEEGRVETQGTFDQVRAEKPELFDYFLEKIKSKKSQEGEEEILTEDDGVKMIAKRNTSKANLQETAEEFEEEQSTTVSWKTYYRYIRE